MREKIDKRVYYLPEELYRAYRGPGGDLPEEGLHPFKGDDEGTSVVVACGIPPEGKWGVFREKLPPGVLQSYVNFSGEKEVHGGGIPHVIRPRMVGAWNVPLESPDIGMKVRIESLSVYLEKTKEKLLKESPVNQPCVVLPILHSLKEARHMWEDFNLGITLFAMMTVKCVPVKWLEDRTPEMKGSPHNERVIKYILENVNKPFPTGVS